MSEKIRKSLKDAVKDESIQKGFYLGLGIEPLMEKLTGLKFTKTDNDKQVPFTAQIRNYHGATDQDGCFWLIKEISEEETVQSLKLQEVAYYMDYLMDTLAAPTILVQIDNTYWRATKSIQKAMQIGSYNYLQEPFLNILAKDLVNRWLYFDEDRNPNNYLVLHNSENEPFIVAIDYNKADLSTDKMKITGLEEKFGWKREEKTRFLTLLKPDNFDDLSIDVFEDRLTDMMGIPEQTIRRVCENSFQGHLANAKEMTELVVRNILTRRDYINTYFRKSFKPRDINKEKSASDRYSGMGQSFLDMYKKK